MKKHLLFLPNKKGSYNISLSLPSYILIQKFVLSIDK